MEEIINELKKILELKSIPQKTSIGKIELLFHKKETIDDFYLLYYCSMEELRKELGEEIVNLEFYINNLIHDLKQDLEEFKGRDLDKNISLVLVTQVNELGENAKIFQKLEENYFVGKKYVIPHLQKDVQIIQNEIQELRSPSFLDGLHRLVSNNSYFLRKDKIESWYLLLLNLFIKLPFLQYKIKSHKGLENITKKLEAEISDSQLKLYHLIKENFDNEEDGSLIELEKFINQHRVFALFDNKEN